MPHAHFRGRPNGSTIREYARIRPLIFSPTPGGTVGAAPYGEEVGPAPDSDETGSSV